MLSDLRRVSPGIRILWVIGLLCIVASLLTFAGGLLLVFNDIRSLIDGLPVTSGDQYVAQMRNTSLSLGLSLLFVGQACGWPMAVEYKCFRRPAHEQTQLPSTRTLALMTARLAAPPLCALVAALLIPQASFLFIIPMLLNVLAAVALLSAYTERLARYSV